MIVAWCTQERLLKKLLLTGVKVMGFSALFAILVGLVVELSGVQIFFLTLVVQCVFVSLIFPGNKKLEATLSKATPFARRVIRFTARLSFAAGITLIVILPFVKTEKQAVGTIVTVLFGVFIGHWLVTRNRDEQKGYQH